MITVAPSSLISYESMNAALLFLIYGTERVPVSVGASETEGACKVEV